MESLEFELVDRKGSLNSTDLFGQLLGPKDYSQVGISSSQHFIIKYLHLTFEQHGLTVWVHLYVDFSCVINTVQY